MGKGITTTVQLVLEHARTLDWLCLTDQEAPDYGAEVADGTYIHAGFTFGAPGGTEGQWRPIFHVTWPTREEAEAARAVWEDADDRERGFLHDADAPHLWLAQPREKLKRAADIYGAFGVDDDGLIRDPDTKEVLTCE